MRVRPARRPRSSSSTASRCRRANSAGRYRAPVHQHASIRWRIPLRGDRRLARVRALPRAPRRRADPVRVLPRARLARGASALAGARALQRFFHRHRARRHRRPCLRGGPVPDPGRTAAGAEAAYPALAAAVGHSDVAPGRKTYPGSLLRLGSPGRARGRAPAVSGKGRPGSPGAPQRAVVTRQGILPSSPALARMPIPVVPAQAGTQCRCIALLNQMQ